MLPIEGFAIMNCVNVSVMMDQVLEGETGEDSIVRKTIQPRFTIQQNSAFLH